MLRRWIKTGVASALHAAGADNVFGARRGVKNLPFVVGYHRVVEDFAASAARSIPPSLISTRTLEHHLDWIGRRFDFITLDELADGLAGVRRFNKPVAAITFDDGYSDVYHHAFPILKRKGIPAAVFVVTDLVGTPRLLVHDQLYLLLVTIFSQGNAPGRRLVESLLDLPIPGFVFSKLRMATDPFRALRALLEDLSQTDVRRVTEALAAEVEVPQGAIQELRCLNWQMLREMSRMGMTVGSHTRTHPLLGKEPWQKVIDEAQGSRRALEQELGMTVAHFAYPDGCFNTAAVQAVATAGYRSAYTTCLHRDARHLALTIPRRLLWEHSCMDAFGRFSPAMMGCQTNAVSGFATRCGRDHGP